MSRQMEVANLGMTFGDMKLQQDGDDGDTDGSDIDGDGRMHPPSYYLGAPATVLRRPAPPGYLDMVEGEEVLEKEREMAVNGPPFPYRVAKALDPVVYRNIEYDVWLEERKGMLQFRPALAFGMPFYRFSSASCDEYRVQERTISSRIQLFGTTR